MTDIRKQLESTLSGNRNAFNEVVSAYWNTAMALAAQRLGNKTLAEEAVQEAFLSAYLNLSRLRNPESFGAWLRAILKRRCSRILRKETSPVTDIGEQDIEDIGALEPYEVYTHYLDRAKVHKILEGFSGTCKEACILRFVHGRPYSEIAEILGVPVGTIKRRLHEAKDKVVREFNREDGRTIRIGHMPISDHLTVMVAHHRHNNRNYSMQLRRFLSWSKLVRCLENATLDAAFVMAPLAMALRNAGLRISYVLDGHHDGSAVTVSAASGRRLDQRTRMALPHAISTHRLFLHTMFEDASRGGAGQEPNNLLTRFINPSYVINSLLRREIDGFFCSEPWSTKSAAQGAGRILARSGDLAPGHICCILVVREDFAESQPDLMRHLIHSLTGAGEYITLHPLESSIIQARYTGIDKDVAEHILVNRYITYQDLAPDRSRAEQVMNMALESDVLTRPCDLKRFVRTDFT